MTLGAYTAIIKDRKILLVHRSYGQKTWTMPGGTIESGESPMQTAVREMKEETGLEVEIKDLIGIYYRKDIDDLIIFFLGEKVRGDEKAGNEIDQLGYYPCDQLPKPMSFTAVQRVKDAFSFSGKVFLREMSPPKEGK